MVRLDLQSASNCQIFIEKEVYYAFSIGFFVGKSKILHSKSRKSRLSM